MRVYAPWNLDRGVASSSNACRDADERAGNDRHTRRDRTAEIRLRQARIEAAAFKQDGPHALRSFFCDRSFRCASAQFRPPVPGGGSRSFPVFCSDLGAAAGVPAGGADPTLARILPHSPRSRIERAQGGQGGACENPSSDGVQSIVHLILRPARDTASNWIAAARPVFFDRRDGSRPRRAGGAS